MSRVSRTIAPAALLLAGAQAFVAPAGGRQEAALRGAAAAEAARPSSISAASVAATGAMAAVAVAVCSDKRRVRGQRRATEVENITIKVSEEAEAPPKPAGPLPGPIIIPFTGSPAYRNFITNEPGDYGFDPAGFGGADLKTYRSMQEAEIKHARLAMLAAVGWPLAELWEPGLAQAWGLDDDLNPGGFVPSVLNGRLELFPQGGFFITFLLFGFIIDMAKIPDTAPGDYEFDPLKLRNFVPPVIGGNVPKGRRWTDDAEIQNGRLAMLAITAYAFQEFASHVPVVKETPFLF